MKFIIIDDDGKECEVSKKQFLADFKDELTYAESLEEENGVNTKVIWRSFVEGNRVWREDGKVFQIEVIEVEEK